MAVDRKPLKVESISSIPCSVRAYYVSWIPGWAGALFLFLPLVWWISTMVYSGNTVWLNDDQVLDVSIEAKGCDVIFESAKYGSSWARLGYWKQHGEGKMTLTDKALTVKTDLVKKEMNSNCVLRLALTDKIKFGKVVVKVEPDNFAQSDPKPSNIAESVGVKFSNVQAKTVHLSVLAAAQTIVQGVKAEKIDMAVSGGAVTIIESSAMAMADSITLDAKDATVEVSVHRKDVELSLDGDTKDTTSVAAAKVTPQGDGYYLSASGKKTSDATKISIKGQSSAIYVLAADHEHMTNKDLSLDVKPSAAMKEGKVTFLPSGVAVLKTLSNWLNTTAESKFMVYMHLTAPNAPHGTMRLMSTSAYTAFSVTMFSLISTGMLQPTIERIQLPVVGFPEKFLWPRREVDGKLTEKEELQFSSEIFSALSAIIDVEKLGYVTARWVWDPQGPLAYIFQKVKVKQGQPPQWQQKPLTFEDNAKFYTAAIITMVLAFLLGCVVCAILNFTVKPAIMRKIRKLAIENAASYRLNYQVYPSTFNLNVVFIHWPVPGVLIRWQKRDLSDQFTALTFAARSWPEPDVHIAKEGVDPWRIPQFPNVPGQQFFLFASQPPKKPEKATMATMSDILDQELWGCAQLRCGDKPLHIGSCVQIRISAYGAGEQLIEKSSWSRPVMIQAVRAFVEYPFLLWTANLGVLPEDSLQYFLDRHMMPMDKAPVQLLTLSNMQLFAENSCELFCGEFDEKYGEDVVAYTTMNYLTCTKPIDMLEDLVYLSGSTGGAIQEHDDGLYVTATATLPKNSDPVRKDAKTFEQVFGRAAGDEEKELSKSMKYITLDFGEQTLPLEIGPLLEQVFRIEATIMKADGTTKPITAKYEATWGDLESLVIGSDGKLSSQIVLRDGLTPAGILKCEAEFSNTVIKDTAKATYADRFPRIFKDLYQGSVFQWGQILTLSWTWEESGQALEEFDIVLVSDGFNDGGKSMPERLWKAKPKEAVVCSKLTFKAGKATVAMSPDQPYYVQTMRCHLEVRKGTSKSATFAPMAASSEFVICRPATLENLELAYAAFCIRNNIPQSSLNRTNLAIHGVRVVERELYIVSGYRAPIPTPYEFARFHNDRGMDTIIRNETSNMITGPSPLPIKVVKKNAEVKAPAISRPSSTGSGLSALAQPLLATEAPPPEEVETIETLQPQRSYVDIPVNAFWNYHASWAEEILLWYRCLPNFAMDGYMASAALEYDYTKLAFVLGRFDDIIRMILRILLFLLQILALWLPAITVFFLIDAQDEKYSTVKPNMYPLQHVDTIFLEDFTLNPLPFVQRWNLLAADGKAAYIFIVGYMAVIIVTTFYCNFVHGCYAGKNPILKYIFFANNYMIISLSTISFFCLIVYACMVALWMVLGALIDPNLIPVAIAIIGVVVLVRMNYNNLITMKNHVESVIYSQLDLVLHAIMEVFVGPPDSDEWLNMAAQATMTRDIAAWLNDIEKSVVTPLLEQSKVQLIVPRWEVADVATRRNSVEFKTFASDIAADKCLATDFVPEEVLLKAQEIANTDAVIDGTRNVYDEKMKCTLDNDLTVKSLNEATALRAESMVPVPGQITQAQKTQLNALAKSMKLRPDTVQVLFKAFIMAEHLAETPEDQVLKDPFSVSSVMAGIRMNQMFTHFVVPKEGDDKKSTMNRFMEELQNADMGMYQVYVAKAMTKLLDWNTVGRNVLEFEQRTIIKTLVRRTVDLELNNYAISTVAFKMMHQLYHGIYEKFDTVYAKDNLQIFLDLGLVDDQYFKKGRCKTLLNHILDSQRDMFGSLYQTSMIAALKNYFFPLLHTESSTDFVEPAFLWYDALKAILKRLGWDDEEMEEKWLAYKWEDATDGSGLFAYRDTEELIEFISHLADKGLWKAATRCIMLKSKIYGYAPCDPTAKEKKEVVEEAHALYLDPNKQLDLEYLGSQTWPGYVKKAWESIAAKTKVNDASITRPRFLQIVNILDFLQEVVYYPEEPSAGPQTDDKLTMLNPMDILDMDKCVDDEGFLWHKLPGGKRKLRGIWLELALEVFDLLSCVPSDLDVFYDNLEFQNKRTSKKDPVLQMNPASQWLKEEYLPKMTEVASFDQFKALLEMVDCKIPADVLKAQVFSKCPLVPGDDLGELRYLTDCGAALRLWIGFGLWKGAVNHMINLVMPPSPMRRMAHQMLDEEFNNLDKEGIGVLQPAQVLVLLHKLAHPGLSSEDVSKTISENLGLEIPPRKCHHYFTLMDVNCDGVMQASEFIPMMRLIMIDYFPQYVLTNMGLSWKFILLFIILLIILIVLILQCVQLVISTFTNGGGIASAIHSGFNACTMALGKMQSDAGSGFNDSVSAVKAYLSDMCMATICAVMGLGKPVVEKITSILKSGI